MNQFLDLAIVIPLGIAVLLAGCEQSISEPVTTDMHEDFDHDHDHPHGPGHDHEHDHEDGFEGNHSHPHSHDHRHGEPLHGGEIASIGHSHHKDGATHYHAEVMPVVENQIMFYVLTESADGDSQEHPIDAKEITAYVNEEGADPVGAQEVTFAGGSALTAMFKAAIPDQFSESQELLIVVPKITLGGERLNFSFTASRPEPATSLTKEKSDEEPQP